MNSQPSPMPSSENKYQQITSKEEIHEKLKKRFYLLNVKQGIHNYFCSYDFRDNEQEMVSFWSEVLNYYYETIFNTFALKVLRILDISRIDGRNPIGLPNILVKLYQNGEYITQDDLNSNSFYNAINPDLYPSSLFGTLKSAVISTITSYVYSTKKDLENEAIYIHKVLFEEHCSTLLTVLQEVLSERDACVITTKEFSISLTERQVLNGNTYLSLCLLYLSKLKKIALFKLDELNTECIKLLRDINDDVTTKDKAIINILLCISNLNKKIEECGKQIQYNHQKSKECLKAKMKENARMCLKKKNFYFKNEQHYNNVLFTLELNLEDLKSMESTMKVKDIMEKVNQAAKDIKLKPEEIENTMDDLKEMNSAINDLKNEWKEYAEIDENDEEINAEIDKLALNIQKEKEGGLTNEEDQAVNSNMFPTVIKDKPKQKQNENMVHQDESIEKILAEFLN